MTGIYGEYPIGTSTELAPERVLKPIEQVEKLREAIDRYFGAEVRACTLTAILPATGDSGTGSACQ